MLHENEIKGKYFNSINDIYLYIDEHFLEFESNRIAINLWVQFRDQAKKSIEKRYSQREIDCLCFEIKGSRLFSQIYSSSKDGVTIHKYPDLSSKHKNMLKYIHKRSVESKNFALKAFYNHLLWKTPPGFKTASYANLAIENYHSAIEILLKLYASKLDTNLITRIGKIYENLVNVYSEIKVNNIQLKNLTKRLLFQTPHVDFSIKHNIISEMTKHTKLFKPLDFQDTLTLFDTEISSRKETVDDFFLVNYYLPTALHIAAKTSSDIKKWHNEIGFAYLRMADFEKDQNRFWIKQNYYTHAIESFKQAGNTLKRKETEGLYSKLKPLVKLNSVKHYYDSKTQNLLKANDKYIKSIAENVLVLGSEDIYKTIASGFFFPKYENIKKAAQSQKRNYLDFMTRIEFDDNKNIKKQTSNTENDGHLFEVYDHRIRSIVLPYLHYIIIPGIKSGKLTFENFISYLLKNSWIGKEKNITDLGGRKTTVNLIGLIAPSLIEFFIQVEAWCNSKYFHPNFVLCIDSLTLKFEGLFRDFCDRASLPTSTVRQKGMQEVYIHDVLNNPTIKDFFNEDDLIFFNYLFSNEGGLNIRNNIAHSLYSYNDYHPDKMLLLIAALLRLAKYDYKEVK